MILGKSKFEARMAAQRQNFGFETNNVEKMLFFASNKAFEEKKMDFAIKSRKFLVCQNWAFFTIKKLLSRFFSITITIVNYSTFLVQLLLLFCSLFSFELLLLSWNQPLFFSITITILKLASFFWNYYYYFQWK